MAFKTGGIDFGALSREADRRRALPPQERDELEARESFGRDAPHIARDEAERDAASMELRVITLLQHVDMRHDMGGEMSATLYYAKPGATIDVSDDRVTGLERAVYKMSEAERIEESRLHDTSPRTAAIGMLDAGAKVTVLGEEKPRRWKGSDDKWRTVAEFQSARMMPGVHTREALMAREPGGIVEASERFVAAKTDRERETIAREFLGQAPAKGIMNQAEAVMEGRPLHERMTEAADMSRYARGPDGELPLDIRKLKEREGR